MELNLAPDPAQLARQLADWLVAYERQVLQTQNRFCIALSGGSTPKALHQLLAEEPYAGLLRWEKWHVFWGDERYVPLSDEQNNARMAFDTLLNRVPIPPGQVHPMRTDLPPAESMADYARTLHTYFDQQPHTFDLVLLGMGSDGHTLSLFPGKDVLQERTAWTAAYYLDEQAMFRLTLTAPVVNKAAAVVFMVAGENKADALRAVRQGPEQPAVYPAQLIQPAGQLLWFVDAAALRG